MEQQENNNINELSSWDFPNTKSIPDGYDWTSIPEATPENMVVLMNKINELTQEINNLKNK